MKHHVWRNIFIVAVVFYSQPTISAEGDTIQHGSKCFIERSGGSKEPIACRVRDPKSSALTEAEKQASVSQFRDFEKSDLADQAKRASHDYKRKSKSNFVATHSLEARTKGVQMKGDKYIVEIVFYNDADFPKKYASGRGYYIEGNKGFEIMDQTFEISWDKTIASLLLGAEYEKYQPNIKAVTKDHVNMTLLLDDSTQLESIIDGKFIRFIHHAGMPPLQLEEIRTSSSN